MRPGGVHQVLGDGGGHKESRQGDICRDINWLVSHYNDETMECAR